MKTKILSSLALSLILFGAKLCAQGSRSPVAKDNHEKIYIHFDKPYYLAGDSIWFKAYLYNNGYPSVLSNNFYLQLEDRAGKVIDEKKYPVSGATVAGCIALKDSMKQGFYTIKAVTKAILDDDPVFFYSKNLFIYNNIGSSQSETVEKKLLLQFFPESGHLIDGIKTQIAFKATDETGRPVNQNGYIKMDTGTVMTTFKSFHDGMGRIVFTPHLGDVFYAETEMNGIKYKFPLPAVEPSGINLKVTDSSSVKIFEITRSKTDRALFDTINLVVKLNNETVYENTIPFGKERALEGMLGVGDLGSGILHFLVTNKDGVPLAERLSFLNNNEYMSAPEFIMTKRDSSKKGANSFQLNFNDTIQRSISVSVTSADAQRFPDKENIYSRILLTSDIKGNIYNPAFYFENATEETKTALDNLMLTQGWTRYNVKKNPVNAANYKDNYLISISGVIRSEKTKMPVSQGYITIEVPTSDSTKRSFEILVGRDGRFGLDSMLIFGNSKLFYSYNNYQGNKEEITIQFDSSIIKENLMAAIPAGSNNANGFANANSMGSEFEVSGNMNENNRHASTVELSAVTLKTVVKKQIPTNEKYASPMFGNSGRVVLDNIKNPYQDPSLSVVQYIVLNVNKVKLDYSQDAFVNPKNFNLEKSTRITADSFAVTTGQNLIVELLVDEIPVNLSIARTVNMSQVAMVKFYDPGFIGISSSSGPGGCLAIYTKKDEDSYGPAAAVADSKYFLYKGYSVTKEFYNPDYSNAALSDAIRDQRTTLYWSPSPKVAGNSKNMKIDFFNNDVSKKLSVIVEGFDARGRLIHFQKEL